MAANWMLVSTNANLATNGKCTELPNLIFYMVPQGMTRNCVTFARGNPPYAYSRYMVDAVEYEFEHDNFYRGRSMLGEARSWLRKQGLSHARLVALERELTDEQEKQIKVIQDYAYMDSPPFHRLLFYADPHIIEFVLNAQNPLTKVEIPAEKQIQRCRRKLIVNKFPLIGIDLWRLYLDRSRV